MLGARPMRDFAASFGLRPELSVRGPVLRLRTLERPAQPYTLQLGLPTLAPVRKGDALLARFQARSAGFFWPLQARTEFVFERAGGDYAKSVLFPAEVGPLWRSFDIPFRAGDDFAAGQAQAHFNLGFDPQQLELAAVEVLACGASPLAGLPATPLTYTGRSPYAPWRWLAERRIERLRKTDIAVRVLDEAGRPAAGAAVRVRLARHAFGFGSAVNDGFLLGGRGGDQRRYSEAITRFFNKAVLENSLKWPYWSGARRAQARLALERLRAQGLDARGHALVWPGWDNLPAELRKLSDRPEALRLKVKEHILEEAAALRGLISEWDVVNEPRSNVDLAAVLGPDSPAEWFRWARQADPSARLYLNEYGILDQGADPASLDAYEALARRLLAGGAPLGGLGLQAHLDNRLTPPAKLLAILDRLQTLGLPLQVTELDIAVSDERLQADYLRDFLTAVFSHPAAEGVNLWGFWQGLGSRAALTRKDWSLTPAGAVWEELVLRRWRTDASGLSDSRGEFKLRGFLGRYEVEAAAGAASGRAQFNAAPGDAGVVVRLTAAPAVRPSVPSAPGR